jgi:hypothetical protein
LLSKRVRLRTAPEAKGKQMVELLSAQAAVFFFPHLKWEVSLPQISVLYSLIWK